MPFRPARARPQHGFTLIELIVAVVVIGLLAVVALPSMLDYIRKSRRTDAFNALATVQAAQERYRSTRSAYAGSALLTAGVADDPPGLGLTNTSPSGYYSISLSGDGPTGYTATATAVSGSSQANDAGCQVMAVRMAAGNIGYGSGATSPEWTDPKRCWAR